MKATPKFLLATILLLVVTPVYAQRTNNSSVLNEQGVAQVKAGHYTAALELFGRAIELNPKLAVAYNNLGATYNALGRYAEAIELLQNALRIKPDYAEAH